MNRNNLKNLFETYFPIDEQEKEHKIKMLDFLNQHSDCFDRSCLTGHFTGSAWLINKSNDSCLLLHHRKLDIWIQPGGHADGDFDLLNVALKEAKEESGIGSIEAVSSQIFDIDIHYIPPYKEIPEHYHYDVRFLLQATKDQLLVQNDESKALKWFGKEKEDLSTASPSVLRMFDKWVSMK